MLNSFVNMEIIGNPINWLIVTLIIIFGAYAAFVIFGNVNLLLPRIPAASAL